MRNINVKLSKVYYIVIGLCVILGAIFIVGSFTFIDESLESEIIGSLFLLFSIGLGIAMLNCCITYDAEGIIVRGFFRRKRRYTYSQITRFKTKRNATYFYTDYGRKIKVSDNYDHNSDRLIVNIKHRSHAQEIPHKPCRLFWDNCSRPYQLLIFLCLVGLVSVICAGIACAIYLPVRESELISRSITVNHYAYSEDGYLCLYVDRLKGYYEINKSLVTKNFTEGLTGRTLTVWITTTDAELLDNGEDTYAGVRVLTDEGGKEVFGLRQSNYACLASDWYIILIFGVIALLFPLFLISSLVAYHKPENHPRLYQSLEDLDFWSRD